MESPIIERDERVAFGGADLAVESYPRLNATRISRGQSRFGGTLCAGIIHVESFMSAISYLLSLPETQSSPGNSGRGGASVGPPCSDKGSLEEQEKSESNEVLHADTCTGAKLSPSPPPPRPLEMIARVREVLLDLEARPQSGPLAMCFLDWRERAAVNSRNRVAGADGGTQDKERAR